MGLLSKLGGLVAAPLTGGASLMPTLIGAGLGAAKHFAVDKPAEKRSREQAAAMMRVSPWSGIQPTAIKHAGGLLGTMAKGGALGATVGESLGSSPSGFLTTGAPSEAGGLNVWKRMDTKLKPSGLINRGLNPLGDSGRMYT